MAKYELATILSLNALGFEKGLAKAKKSTGDFQAFSKTAGNAITSALSFAGIAGAGILSFEGFKKVLESTQLTGDKLEEKIAGIQEVANTVAQNLANLDFSVSLKKAKKAAEEYAQVLDDLTDRKRSADIISAKNLEEVEKLKGTLTNANASEKDRLAASQRIKEIAKEELDLKKQIAVEALKGVRDFQSDKYGISEEQSQALLDYVQNYSKYSKAEQDALTEAMQAQKRLDTFRKNNSDVRMYDYKKDNELVDNLTDAIAKVNPELQQYISLWRPLNDLSDGQRDNIAKISIDWYNANTAIQGYLNKADKVEDKLEKISEKDIAKNIREATDAITTYNEQIHVDYNEPVVGGTKGQTKGSTTVFADSNKLGNVKEQAQVFGDSWTSSLSRVTTFTNTLSDAFSQLFNTIDNAASDGKISFVDAMKIMASTAQGLAIVLEGLAAAQMISSQSSKGLIGLVTAAAGVASLVAMFASFVFPKTSGFASGGVVGGTSYTGDHVPIMANSGEWILNRLQQQRVSKMVASGSIQKIEIVGECQIRNGDIHIAYKKRDNTLNAF